MSEFLGSARRLLVLLAAAAILLQPSAFGWWDSGHMLINRVAAQKIPDSMPAFLHQAVDRLQYLGPEPDRWRERTEPALKASQEPDHFIDLERVDWMDKLPPDRYAFYRALYERRAHTEAHPDDLLPERVGLQPYITMEIYERLKVAFREYRRLQAENKPTDVVEGNIIFYMGWLGHYVADGANPLHTTVNYNGWVGDNPNGYTTERNFHGKFEGEFVNRNLARLPIADLVKAPTRLQDPFNDYIQYLRDSHSLVEKTYQIDKAGGFNGTGTAESIDFVRRRMAAGCQMLLNFWYTAWLESATPVARPS